MRLFHILITLISLGVHVYGCPQSIAVICKCLSIPSGLRIQCDNQPLDLIVRSIPVEAKVDQLIIRDNAGMQKIPRAFGALSIRELDLAGNKITQIEDGAFDGVTEKLLSLILANNSLSVVPGIGTLTNLENIDLSGNSITSIPDNAFAGMEKLRRLQLRANRICKLDPNALIETKEHLETLDLSHNCLDEVPAPNLRGSSKLQYLDLSDNRITSVPSLRFMNLPSLVHLRLDGNGMEQLHPLAFMNVPNLEQLYLSRNKLTSLDTNRFQSFTKLAKLDLSENRLNKLSSNSFQNMPSLRHLILDNNQIEYIETLSFSGMPDLRVISVQNNGLQKIHRNAFDALPGMVGLLIRNNSIENIEEGTFAGLPNLQELILSQNRLTSLPADAFDSINQLLVLDLSTNEIRTLADNVFHNLNKLFWLDVSENRLTGFPVDVLPNKLSNLLLHSNPLVCNESIDWLIQYLVSNNVRTFLPGQIDVTCSDPPEKRGILLKDLMLHNANATYFSNRGSNSASNQNSGLDSTRIHASGNGQAGNPAPADSAKSLSQLVSLLGGNRAVDLDRIDLTQLPPEIVRYVSQGGQVPGLSAETMQLLRQKYLVQMTAKNQAASESNGVNVIPPPISVLNSSIPSANDRSGLVPTTGLPFLITAGPQLPPLSSFSPDLIRRVLNGETIPGLTMEQTESVKRHYMEQILNSNSSFSNTTIVPPVSAPKLPFPEVPHNSFFNISDLRSLNIDVGRISPDVLRDLAAEKTPDFSKIPEDIIQKIMEKRPMLFGEIVTRELRVKAGGLSNVTKSIDNVPPPIWESKRPSYDVNDLDKMADISVLQSEEGNHNLALWTAACLGVIGTVTILAVAVLCWRRRVWRTRMLSARPPNEDTSDTSKFFEHPIRPRVFETLTPRTKAKLVDKSGIRSTQYGADNAIFNIDPLNNARCVGPPQCTMGCDDHWTGGNRMVQSSADINNRINNHLFNYDPIHRLTSGPQTFSTVQTPQHYSRPPLPSHPSTQAAIFDHLTASWMFHPQSTSSSSYR